MVDQGSPERLVEQVYQDSAFLPQVQLVGSRIVRRYGGWVLTLRCSGEQKVTQLEQRLGAPLKLYSGYSDSKQDNPLLYFCEHRWRVSKRVRCNSCNSKGRNLRLPVRWSHCRAEDGDNRFVGRCIGLVKPHASFNALVASVSVLFLHL